MNQERITSLIFGIVALLISVTAVAECKYTSQRQQDTCLKQESARNQAESIRQQKRLAREQEAIQQREARLKQHQAETERRQEEAKKRADLAQQRQEAASRERNKQQDELRAKQEQSKRQQEARRADEAKHRLTQVNFVYDCNHFPGQGALARKYTDSERKFVKDCAAQSARTISKINASNQKLDRGIKIAQGVKKGADIAGTAVAVGSGVAEGALAARAAYGAGKAVIEKRATMAAQSAATSKVDVTSAGSITKDGATAAERARTINGALSSRTQGSVTTAVTETREGVRIVTSSEGRLRPAQRDALLPGEIAGVGKRGTHAEINGVNAAREAGLTPTSVAPSWSACPTCVKAMQEEGVPIRVK